MSGLLLAGTTSEAGESVPTTGLCRALARRGVDVARFKTQNMSNNSMLCVGPDGAMTEIGRAPWVQALAARVDPEPALGREPSAVSFPAAREGGWTGSAIWSRSTSTSTRC